MKKKRMPLESLTSRKVDINAFLKDEQGFDPESEIKPEDEIEDQDSSQNDSARYDDINSDDSDDDVPDDEDNIMRALSSGNGDLYGF